MSNIETLRIKELNLDIIPPCTAKMNDPEYGGSKIIVIGKPGTGKSTLIGSLLYAKKHIFPCGVAFSGTEDSNHFYKSVLPSSFVFNTYDEGQIEKVLKSI